MGIRDVYMVNLIIGLGLVLFLVNVKRWLSLFLLMMIMPLIRVYMRILTGLIGRVHINESVKKLITLRAVVILGGIVLEWGYVSAFIYFFGRVTRTVVLGVYVFIIIGIGMWVVIWSYVLLGNFIRDNYKILRLGILPLIVFFVKVCGSYVLLWIVIVYSIYSLL